MTSFYSKRNEVSLVGGAVEKRFPDEERALTEARALERLYAAGVPVPRLLSRAGAVLRLEYIPGETLPDFLAAPRCESELGRAAAGLIRWFAVFYAAVRHKETAEIRGDVNGRNFLLADSAVLSVDFEAAAYGDRETDVGRLLAFVRTYDLPGKAAQAFFERSLREHAVLSLTLREDRLDKAVEAELAAMAERRKPPAERL